MARKRPAPAEFQSNESNLPVNKRYTTFSSASEVSNQNGINSQRTVQNRSALSMFQDQQQQHLHHQQQTLVKTRTKNSASSLLSSTSTTTSLSTHPMQSQPQLKHWQDELMEFSTQITRQAHFTLARIANYFRTNGMQFDADFRNHFLYISNNRLLESYDSFLIGLPREMKCDEYQIQRPNTNFLPTHTEVNRQQQSFEPLVKRKCIENGTTPTVSDPIQSKQIAVIKKASRLSKSMSKLGTQVSIQKVTSAQQSANVASPLPISAGTTGTANNQLKIKNVKSLHQSAATNAAAYNPLNNDNSQMMTGDGGSGNNTENGSVKKIRVISTSKIPGRVTRMLVPVTTISAGQINAQSTPNKPSVVAAKKNFIPEDPLKISDTTTATAELTIEPIINVRPAFIKEVTRHQTTKQLSTSLPLMNVTTTTPATAVPPIGIVTRSRNNAHSERTKRSYECDLCAFTTEVRQNLMRHDLLHTTERAQMCKICKKRFPRRSLLLAHMREYHHELHSDLTYWE